MEIYFCLPSLNDHFPRFRILDRLIILSHIEGIFWLPLLILKTLLSVLIVSNLKTICLLSEGVLKMLFLSLIFCSLWCVDCINRFLFIYPICNVLCLFSLILKNCHLLKILSHFFLPWNCIDVHYVESSHFLFCFPSFPLSFHL